MLGFFFPRLPTPGHASRDRARRRIAELFSRIMAARRLSGAAPDDFMQGLMQASYKDGRALNDDEITGILLTVLFAGQHTSAVLATWTGLELLRAPSYLAQVRDEISDVYRAEGVMSLSSLKQQTALEHAVRGVRAAASAVDSADSQGPQAFVLQRLCCARRGHGCGVAGGLTPPAPPVCRPGAVRAGTFCSPRRRTQATPLRPDRFWRRQTPLHGGTFCLPAVESDPDRTAGSLRP